MYFFSLNQFYGIIKALRKCVIDSDWNISEISDVVHGPLVKYKAKRRVIMKCFVLQNSHLFFFYFPFQ